MTVFLSSCGFLYQKLGGNFKFAPEELEIKLSPLAQELVKEAFNNLDPKKASDFHVHVVGLGHGNTGAYVSSEYFSWKHPFKKMRYSTYLSAAGIKTPDTNADQQYLDRLRQLTKYFGFPSKFHILAFDKHYRKDGTVNTMRTEIYTPNDYVMAIFKQYPNVFVPTISVHPYRKDALITLEKYHKQGAKFIKWLPNSMGIDPSSSLLNSYYEKVKELDMVILSHVGYEAAVDGGEFQKLGNPLLFRKPLDLGVKIIMAHCASLNEGLDLDHPENGQVDNYQLFLRLMKEEKYKNNLWGEISAITQYNRLDSPLKSLLEHPELHKRLVNGSDYPLPGINFLVRSKNLFTLGYITKEERMAINEIYAINPLLFDFVLKRTLKHPKTKQKFAHTVFENPF
jgi:predicted TIM-barrel fold metal-dependent hydrolase